MIGYQFGICSIIDFCLRHLYTCNLYTIYYRAVVGFIHSPCSHDRKFTKAWDSSRKIVYDIFYARFFFRWIHFCFEKYVCCRSGVFGFAKQWHSSNNIFLRKRRVRSCVRVITFSTRNWSHVYVIVGNAYALVIHRVTTQWLIAHYPSLIPVFPH